MPAQGSVQWTSHRLTSTLIDQCLSFSAVKTSWKSAVFRRGAKSDPLSGLLLLYPLGYRPAFASSNLLYPLHLPHSLRSGYHLSVEHIGLTRLMLKRDTCRLGWRLSPGGDCGVADSSVLCQSAPRTFWLQRLTLWVVSLLRCSLLTRCTTLHLRSPCRLFPGPPPP